VAAQKPENLRLLKVRAGSSLTEVYTPMDAAIRPFPSVHQSVMLSVSSFMLLSLQRCILGQEVEPTGRIGLRPRDVADTASEAFARWFHHRYVPVELPRPSETLLANVFGPHSDDERTRQLRVYREKVCCCKKTGHCHSQPICLLIHVDMAIAYGLQTVKGR